MFPLLIFPSSNSNERKIWLAQAFFYSSPPNQCWIGDFVQKSTCSPTTRRLIELLKRCPSETWLCCWSYNILKVLLGFVPSHGKWNNIIIYLLCPGIFHLNWPILLGSQTDGGMRMLYEVYQICTICKNSSGCSTFFFISFDDNKNPIREVLSTFYTS